MKKNSRIWFYQLFVMGLILILTYSCKKDEDSIMKITDADGNVYASVTLGSQDWLVENLKTTKYNDNTNIPLITDNAEWAALSSPAYCLYNNDIGKKEVYGALYNWYSVNSNKLCPIGWHVPTDEDWTILTEYLANNGYGYEGSGADIGKSLASKSGWSQDPTPGFVGNDQSTNNKSGFNAVPSGYRIMNGEFANIGEIDYWWTATEFNDAWSWMRHLFYQTNMVYRWYDYKQYGYSVRCIKD
jgi:uncharacterized protein (TIGR02145 family)